MITFLKGILVEALPTRVALDVHGVGYEVLIPLSSFEQLPHLNHEVTLLTQLIVREDSQTLYGFMNEEERQLFVQLVHAVSGIGPRIALNILSGLPIESFRRAIASGDVKTLSSISGIGKKTAERIVVELKDKMGKSVSGSDSGVRSIRPGQSDEEKKISDAVLALEALGYKPAEATLAVQAAQAALGSTAGVEELVRAGLIKRK